MNTLRIFLISILITMSPSVDAGGPEGCADIPDDAYDGSLETMLCVERDGVPGEVISLEVDMGVDHAWVGDLVIKTVSPDGTLAGLLSRPGYDEPFDNGASGGKGSGGTSSDLASTSPIVFSSDSVNIAEDMGLDLSPSGVICQDDGICDFRPSPGSIDAPGLTAFVGLEGAGTWRVCFGDVGFAIAGSVCTLDLIFETTLIFADGFESGDTTAW